MLAAGAHSATFMGGVGENDALRNAAPEGTRNTFVPTTDASKVARKKFIPRKGVLLVRRDEVVVSSVIVTDTMEKEKPAEGIILEVNPSCGSGFNFGDHVVFGKYAGAEFKLNGETLLLMDADEIKGTIIDEVAPTRARRNKNTFAGGCIPGIARS